MRIAARFGMHFVAATPPGYEPTAEFVAAAAADAAATGGSVELETDPVAASTGAQALYTDVWTSMGSEPDRERRVRAFEPYRVDAALLDVAEDEAVVLHCLPAHVGEEIAADVLYGPRCLAWEQAENRLHTQKSLMALVIQ
jgi:ornithine carbamoyltransferase